MYICKMSYSSAMKKRYQLLKRVSIILIFFVLFTKMHVVETFTFLVYKNSTFTTN